MPFTKGHTIWLGRTHTKESRDKMSIARKGEVRSMEWRLEHSERLKALGIKPPSRKGIRGAVWPQWKGDNVKYTGLHAWVKRYLGTPLNCSNCNVEGKKNSTRWSIHWANKSHQYKRDLVDWIALCAKCHKAYDTNYK